MRYRRADMAGGSYFFTVTLLDRQQGLLVEYVNVLREVMRNVKSAHPFHIDAMVILPDHLHALWTLPAGESDYPMRWMLIKSGFSRRLPLGGRRTASRRAKGERGIWQRRYWEHLIRDERDSPAMRITSTTASVGWGEARPPTCWTRQTTEAV